MKKRINEAFMTQFSSTNKSKQSLFTDIQTHGIRLLNREQEHVSRRGGAGPSDHQAIVIDDTSLMVPVHTQSSIDSPYTLDKLPSGGTQLMLDGKAVTDVSFAKQPAFYTLKTADGIPYSKIATLHSTDVLATTVLQTCIRYETRKQTCKFCSIGQSLAADRTIARKTPEQLAEVAKAAVELDHVKHMVMTTGTTASDDRGAKVLCESVLAVKSSVDLPIQVQCEPPKDLIWLQRLKDAGADSLGLHLEAVSPKVRQHVMPSKASISIEEYMTAFQAAVPIFGWAQVSTYILAGLGDSAEEILEMCERLTEIGVYPFVVPFVPIRGTPMEDHQPPSSEFMHSILEPLGHMLQKFQLLSTDVKAGCARCGACSSLKSFEGHEKENLTSHELTENKHQTLFNAIEIA